MHDGDRPPGWTDDDEAAFDRMTAELIADTDNDLIDELDAEHLTQLNNEAATTPDG